MYHDFDLARKYAYDIRRLATKVDDWWQYAAGTYYLGLISRRQSLYDESLEFLHESLHLYDSMGADDFSRTGALFNLGAVHEAIGDYEVAIEYFLEELEINRKEEYVRGVANSLNSLGTVNLKLKNHAVAKKYFLRSLEQAMRAADTITQANALHNLSLLHIRGQKLDSALISNSKAIQLNMAVDNPFGLTYDFQQEARIFLEQGDHNNALKSALLALKYASVIGEHENRLVVYELLAQIRYDMGRLTESQAWIDSAFALRGKWHQSSWCN